MMAALIVLSFALLGATFIGLSYRYTVTEKRESMERNADYIANFTGLMQASGTALGDKSYQSYVASIAMISDAYVVVTQNDGQVVFSADGERQEVNALAGYLPQDVINAVNSSGDYAGMTTLGGLFSEKRFVAGTPILLTNAFTREPVQLGLVFVAAETSSITGLWRAFTSIFFFTAVVVLCIAFIASSVTSLRQTKPLNEIAEAARKFGHGELDVRVRGYENRRDEVGELAEAFNAMADSLAKSEARRSEFVANISHELKTPMTTIAGYTDGILDGTIPPEQEKEYLRIISDESRRLSRLVRRMLEVSQLQSRDLNRTKAPFDVCESMRRVLISMEKKITDRGLDVDADIPDSGIMVLGDNDLITQVIYNLLENATKFARAGSTLYLGLAVTNGRAVVSVRNEGDTIPAEEIPLLFERFHKSDKSRSEDKDGVGLGLYVVKTILDQHKEHIAVTSENGLTTFTFTVTLAGGQIAPQ